jgi:hypothetical protein
VKISRLRLALLLGLLAGIAGGCASSAAPEEIEKVPVTYAPVPGEAFLRAPDRTLVALEVRIAMPLHLESEVFLGGDKVRRYKDGDKKVKEARGHASMQFAEGLRIHHDTERVIVTFDPAADRIRLKARGQVLFMDQAEGRKVSEATSLEVNGATVVFRGPYKEGSMPRKDAKAK